MSAARARNESTLRTPDPKGLAVTASAKGGKYAAVIVNGREEVYALQQQFPSEKAAVKAGAAWLKRYAGYKGSEGMKRRMLGWRKLSVEELKAIGEIKEDAPAPKAEPKPEPAPGTAHEDRTPPALRGKIRKAAGPGRPRILGKYSLCRAIGWMGKAGWSLEEARRVVKALGFDTPWVQPYHIAGKTGDNHYGEPCEIVGADAAELEKHRATAAKEIAAEEKKADKAA